MPLWSNAGSERRRRHLEVGSLKPFILLHEAEQVAIRILQNHEVGSLSMSPGISLRTHGKQPAYLAISIVRVEI